MARLKELAELVGGRVVGDPELEIRRLADFDEAGEGDIAFVSRASYARRLHQLKASAVILSAEAPISCSQLICANPYLAFARILAFLEVEKPRPLGIMDGAWVDPSAEIGDEVTIYPGCHVAAGARVGRGTILYPNVVLYPDVVLGEDCVLHAGVIVREKCHLGDRVIVQPNAVIGSDGFGFAPDGERYEKIPQVGVVVIENDVEIGAGTCIDRAALGETRIGEGCKLDNLVQIGHNVRVGPHTVMAGQTGIAGSTIIGRHCTFGGQSGTAGHIKVGDNVTVAGRGGVASDTEGGQVLSGAPAMPHKEWLKASLTYVKLPEMRRELNRLKKEVAALTAAMKELGDEV
ncbi:UDP-3-O-[3-hydroxymyristoyl] glucosamine N-acyltransferase [Geothermobacter ehrlichii]|uniref:UDP-3-O-acylglucosamine N-acyltransferase n=1 Tax=Geothermobacter ehrlichii TaxID=213224 RepID=A0A5D3WR23_9BACT|nr:UDP-3-O-(3-hydroxymyristoyl)glucosamine N-acyltransferase [Geothermobacter ehrlichii]TYP00039.1 UDP-3-O-[3-hydroxymyristoyl] glucosamine N-acyltransferase [Geothermobacter ehrlichii]